MKNLLKQYKYKIMKYTCIFLAIIYFTYILESCIWKGMEEYQAKQQEEKNTCEEMIESERIPIYSMNLSSVSEGYVKGAFTFIRGSYKEESFYTFYRVMDDGGKVLIKIPTENAAIYNDENESPYILENTTCSWDIIGREKKDYKIHIPENALQQEYDGSLSNLK